MLFALLAKDVQIIKLNTTEFVSTHAQSELPLQMDIAKEDVIHKLISSKTDVILHAQQDLDSELMLPVSLHAHLDTPLMVKYVNWLLNHALQVNSSTCNLDNAQHAPIHALNASTLKLHALFAQLELP